jgi:hypothetical protein
MKPETPQSGLPPLDGEGSAARRSRSEAWWGGAHALLWESDHPPKVLA